VNSWKVILATMVIFGAGVITGGLLVHQTGGQKKTRPPRVVSVTNALAHTVTPAQLQRMDFLVRANRELDLTPEQRERIERILREGQERSRQIWETIAPDMRKEFQLVRERIKVELTPEQRRRFEELMKRPPRPAVRPGNPDDAPPNPNNPRINRRENLPPPTLPPSE
jgi:DNA-binding MarR family transcriptional regulator